VGVRGSKFENLTFPKKGFVDGSFERKTAVQTGINNFARNGARTSKMDLRSVAVDPGFKWEDRLLNGIVYQKNGEIPRSVPEKWR
jgi:hypothetical protein